MSTLLDYGFFNDDKYKAKTFDKFSFNKKKVPKYVNGLTKFGYWLKNQKQRQTKKDIVKEAEYFASENRFEKRGFYLTKFDYVSCLLCDGYFISPYAHLMKPELDYISQEEHLQTYHRGCCHV